MAAVRPIAGGVELHVRVTPNAGADRVEGFALRDDGSEVLRLRVAAVPDKGRANAAAIALLGKALGVPKTDIRVHAGETARLKTLHIVGDPAALIAAIEGLAGRPKAPKLPE